MNNAVHKYYRLYYGRSRTKSGRKSPEPMYKPNKHARYALKIELMKELQDETEG